MQKIDRLSEKNNVEKCILENYLEAISIYSNGT